MSRVLLTGCSGFLGRHLSRALTEHGHEVVGYDREDVADFSGSRFVKGELTDKEAISEALAGCRYVFHLAGFSDLNAARNSPVETVEANVLGTVLLLEAARQAKIERFLFASTVYVYSRSGGFYRCSKQACESYIEEFAATYDLPYTILRYGSLYGPGSDARNGVHRLLLAAMNDGKVDYGGAEDDRREYIHVRDAADLTVAALDERYVNARLLLTGPTSLRASDLFMMFQEILGRPIEVSYQNHGGGHYSITPYAFTPKPGVKLVANPFVDMGQGVLQLVEELSSDVH